MADDGCHILPTFKSKVMEFKRPMFGFLEVSNQPIAAVQFRFRTRRLDHLFGHRVVMVNLVTKPSLAPA